MTETPESISLWATTTFGHQDNIYRTIGRAAEEALEALRECFVDPLPLDRISEECADSVIVLCRALYVIKPTFDNVGLYDHVKPPAPTSRSLQIDIAYATHNLINAANPACRISMISGRLYNALYGLTWVSNACGVPMQKAVDAKMKVNRGRTWNLVGQHHHRA